MPAPRAVVCAVLVAACACAARAHAADAPLPRGDLFAFPGANPSPASARSAAFALADRWLGDEPFDHAAGALSNAVSLSPIMQRISRQDVRARSTHYDETRAFFDAAGAYISFASRGGVWGVAPYASQPVLRREESAFQEGVEIQPTIPATVRTSTKTREWRTGVALAWSSGPWAFGVAPEFTKRFDVMTQQRDGANLTGVPDTWDVSGSGAGFNLSARFAQAQERHAHAVRIGASVRAVPELTLTGTVPATGGGSGDTELTREAAWEGGVSIEAWASPTFKLVLGGGGRTETAWTGIAARNGVSAQAALAGEYHDPETPWFVRFGVGRESNPGTRESAASQLGLGFGWVDSNLRYDVGLLHRGIERTGAPNSSDDRIVASLTLVLDHAARAR